MATVEQGGEETFPLSHPAVVRARLGWPQILAISIFWLALSLHWAALSIIILPSQVFKLVGQAQQGEALAFVLIPGAFVSLLVNPLFGLFSDRTRGWLALWGRRRPYILFGTIVNVGGLIWMAASRDVVSLAIAYVIVQFSNNAATAPFHALLPDIVPEEQRGFASGVMGLLATVGSIAGVILAGLLIDASRPLPAYEQGLWLTYGIIIVILVALMLVTILSVRERMGVSAQMIAREESPLASADAMVKEAAKRVWISRATLVTIAATLMAGVVAWGLLALWNLLHIGGVQVSGDVQQVILEVVVTFGLLRLFDFNPRRDPDFAWVLVTRLVMMLGLYMVQDFLQFFLRDAVGVTDAERQTTVFISIVALTSLTAALIAGWLSDRFGRKRIVYISGSLIALVGIIFIITQSLPIVLAAGSLFGLAYGAYVSVDWALVADVLPSQQNYARDMGVWNISLSLPQIIAPVIGGSLIDTFTRSHQTVLGYQLLFGMAVVFCLLGTITVRYIRGVKR